MIYVFCCGEMRDLFSTGAVSEDNSRVRPLRADCSHPKLTCQVRRYQFFDEADSHQVRIGSTRKGGKSIGVFS